MTGKTGHLLAAVALAESGLALIPLDPRSKGGKSPHQVLLRALRGGGWSSLREHAAGADEVREWYARDADCGIGVITGKPSGIAVVDVDDVDASPVRRDIGTPTLSTPRGFHYWFATKGQVRGRRLPFGDLLADGEYAATLGPGRAWEVAPSGLAGLYEAERVAAPLPLESVTQLLDGPDLKFRSNRTTSPLNLVSGADVGEWGGSGGRGYGPRCDDLRSAKRVAAALGLGFPGAQCPLHDDRQASGSFSSGGKDGGWIFRCHAACGTWSVPGLWMWATHEVHPARVPGPTFKLWVRRLQVELGLVVVPNELPPLPPSFPKNVSRYWDGYRLLVRCERLSPDSPGWPPFSHDFAVQWVQMPRTTCRDARERLMKAHWLRSGDRITFGASSSWCYRWEPGPEALGAIVNRQDNVIFPKQGQPK